MSQLQDYWVKAPKLPANEWERQLEKAFCLLVSAPSDLSSITMAFQPLLKDVLFHKDTDRVEQIRALACKAFAQLPTQPGVVSLEGRHLSWHLQHLGYRGVGSSNVFELTVVIKDEMSGYKDHEPSGCAICSTFPGDRWLTEPVSDH